MPRRGRETLHSYVSRLRQALAEDGELAISHRSGGYVLTGPVDLRLSRERSAAGRFAEALELWRGEPLAGLSGEWAEEERDRLTRERLTMLHDHADARLRLGRAHVRLDQFDQASGVLHRALAHTQEHGLLTPMSAHFDLAWMWERRGDDHKALEHARQALASAREHDEKRVGEALNLVGWHAARTGDYDQARSHCEEALALHHANDFLLGIAGTVDSLGYVNHLTGRHREAIAQHQQSITMLRALGFDAEVLADVHEYLGRPHAALGEREQARAA